MEFTLRKKLMLLDQNNEPTVSFESTLFTAELNSDGIFNVYQNIDDVTYKILEQPWSFDDNGNRIPWDSVNDGIDWFRQNNSHIEE